MSKIVREASFQEKFALNPEVTLVTLGESFGWQVPLESNIFEHAFIVSERLVRLWDENSHPDHQAVRSQYPKISNGATYALYVFFNSDEKKSQNWCDTYQALFGTSPMRRSISCYAAQHNVHWTAGGLREKNESSRKIFRFRACLSPAASNANR